MKHMTRDTLNGCWWRGTNPPEKIVCNEDGWISANSTVPEITDQGRSAIVQINTRLGNVMDAWYMGDAGWISVNRRKAVDVVGWQPRPLPVLTTASELKRTMLNRAI